MDKAIVEQVRTRAGRRCEYCQVSMRVYDQPFHIDHIVAKKHGGSSHLDNLALSCLDCNCFKGTDLSGIDPDTGTLSRLYNPRLDLWNEHFEWSGPMLVGLTPIGRTTAAVLQINQPIRVRARAVLMREGVFPSSK